MKKALKRIFAALGIILLLSVGYFLLVRMLDRKVVERGDFYAGVVSGTSGPQLLPSIFLEGERFYLKLPAQSGDSLLCFGDTGGGISMILPATVRRRRLEGKLRLGMLRGLMPLRYILFGDLVKDEGLPRPVAMRHMQIRRPLAAESAPFLIVPPEDEEIKSITKAMQLDVFLGQNFFMGKAWTIDYPRRQIWVNTPLAPSSPGVQPLGFRKNAAGEKTFGHPRLSVVVDGAPVEMLFDTGATLLLSDSARQELHTAAASAGGSFIARSIFDAWRQRHPDWKVYPGADAGRDLIEVPQVTLGGCTVGPVLFAKRDDDVWSAGMAATMDKVVKGAIGGSALKYLKVTVDYNSELIRFER